MEQIHLDGGEHMHQLMPGYVLFSQPIHLGKNIIKEAVLLKCGCQKTSLPCCYPPAWHCWLCQVDWEGLGWFWLLGWLAKLRWSLSPLWRMDALGVHTCPSHTHPQCTAHGSLWDLPAHWKINEHGQKQLFWRKNLHGFKWKLGLKVHSYWSIVHLPTTVLQEQ